MIWPNEENALTYAGLRAPRRILWQSRNSGVVRGLTLVAHRKRVKQAKRRGQHVFKAWDRLIHAFIWYEGVPTKPEVVVIPPVEGHTQVVEPMYPTAYSV